MINEQFDPSAAANFGHFNDPALTRRMRQAATLSGQRRLGAYARLDADLTQDDPPAAAWGIGTFRDFFSARVRCQTYQPSGASTSERSAFDNERALTLSYAPDEMTKPPAPRLR